MTWLNRVRAVCALGRIVSVLSVLALAGCTSKIIAGQTDDVSVETVRGGSKSLVLFHTSLHEDRSCGLIDLWLAQPDDAGRWAQRQTILLKGGSDYGLRPKEMMLPAGDYGIVLLSCAHGRGNIQYTSRVVQLGNLLTGRASLYDRPFATFRVGAGEVVDIGSIRVATGKAADADGSTHTVFAASVAPIPDPMLADFARRRPDLHSVRVVRQMVATRAP